MKWMARGKVCPKEYGSDLTDVGIFSTAITVRKPRETKTTYLSKKSSVSQLFFSN